MTSEEAKKELYICTEVGQFGGKVSYKAAQEAESPLALSNLLLCGFRDNLPCLGEDSLSEILTWPSKNMGGTDWLTLQEPLDSPCKS